MRHFHVAQTFVTHWIARFGVPHVVTTDRGKQFESSLFASLTHFVELHVSELLPTILLPTNSWNVFIANSKPHGRQPTTLHMTRLKRVVQDLEPPKDHLQNQTIHVPPALQTCTHVAQTFVTHWIARFGVPHVVTTDRGKQFESSLFASLTHFVELHVSELLPTILLPTNSWNVFIANSKPHGRQPTTLHMTRLKRVVQDLEPPKDHLQNQTIHVPPALQTCTHVFIRQDAVRKPLQPPYDGPFNVISRTTKHLSRPWKSY